MGVLQRRPRQVRPLRSGTNRRDAGHSRTRRLPGDLQSWRRRPQPPVEWKGLSAFGAIGRRHGEGKRARGPRPRAMARRLGGRCRLDPARGLQAPGRRRLHHADASALRRRLQKRSGRHRPEVHRHVPSRRRTADTGSHARAGICRRQPLHPGHLDSGTDRRGRFCRQDRSGDRSAGEWLRTFPPGQGIDLESRRRHRALWTRLPGRPRRPAGQARASVSRRLAALPEVLPKGTALPRLRLGRKHFKRFAPGRARFVLRVYGRPVASRTLRLPLAGS